MQTQAPVRHHFSVDSLRLMEAAGVFAADQRIELLAGEVINMSPIHAPHATAVRNLLRIFQQHLLLERYMIDAQNPLQLSEDSLPQPDIAVAPYQKKLLQLGHWHASDVRLVVEISDSTYRYDRNNKYAAYAEAGIPEYWILNLKKKRLEVFTEPVGASYMTEKMSSKTWETSFGFLLDVAQLFSFL